MTSCAVGVRTRCWFQFYVQVKYGSEIKLCSEIVIGTVPLHETVAQFLPQHQQQDSPREYSYGLPRVSTARARRRVSTAATRH